MLGAPCFLCAFSVAQACLSSDTSSPPFLRRSFLYLLRRTPLGGLIYLWIFFLRHYVVVDIMAESLAGVACFIFLSVLALSIVGSSNASYTRNRRSSGSYLGDQWCQMILLFGLLARLRFGSCLHLLHLFILQCVRILAWL